MIYGTHPKFDDQNGAYRSFRDLDLCVEQARRTLEPKADTFTSLVVTGISGLAVGAPVALALKKPLIVIRKSSPDDVCGGGSVLGEQDLGEAPLFFDDLISSGGTFRRCRSKIGQPFTGGTYTYESDIYESPEQATWRERDYQDRQAYSVNRTDIKLVARMDGGRMKVGLDPCGILFVRDTKIGSRDYKRGWFCPAIQELEVYLERCAGNFGWDVVRLDGGTDIPASDPWAQLLAEPASTKEA